MASTPRLSRMLLYGFLAVAGFLAFLPFAWMVSASFMTQAEVIRRTLLPGQIQWKNYAEAWRQANFGLYFRNSFVIASLQVLGIWVFSSLAAYPLAKMSFPGRDALFMVILATLMIPESVTLVPNFLTVTWIHRHSPIPWINSWPSLTIPFMCNAFSIFLLRQFFATIPDDFWDAARVDGAGHLRFLARIVVPMSRAPLMTVGMLAFMAGWNGLAWPLLVTNTPNWRPISVGLLQFADEQAVQIQLQMAGALIAILPVLFIYFLIQREFTESIVMSGVKG